MVFRTGAKLRNLFKARYRHELLGLTIYRRPNQDFQSYGAIVTLYNRHTVRELINTLAIRVNGVGDRRRIVPYSRMQHRGNNVVDLYVAPLLPLDRKLQSLNGKEFRDTISHSIKKEHDAQVKRAYDNWFQHENEVAQNMAHMSVYVQTKHLFRALDNDASTTKLSLEHLEESIVQEKQRRKKVLNEHSTEQPFFGEGDEDTMPEADDVRWNRLSLDRLAASVQV
eukprot:COSAG01_NODE_7514_length_3174_cov_1.355772_1_plen_224_part_10